MKLRLLKLLLLPILYILPSVGSSGAYFTSDVTLNNISVSTGCWVAPSVPVLVSPSDNTISGKDSVWDKNPVMDWQDSTTTCPLATTIQYQYESYSDQALTHLVYQSVWLNNSSIPAAGTPDGTYYWRVKSRDDHGNESAFSTAWKLVVDRVAPNISNINHILTDQNTENSKATISWIVSEPATCTLSYSTDNETWTTSSDNEIKPLLAPSTYYYKIACVDSAGNTNESEIHSFVTDAPPSPTLSGVVLNEFMPDPNGNDQDLRPNGEWVELYNRGGQAVNLMGWYLTNHTGSKLYLTTINSTDLVIQPMGFVVVYRNSHSDFALRNNNNGDVLSLYNNQNVLQDKFEYSHDLGYDVVEGKSFARIPDGSDHWVDPTATPGSPNLLDPEIELTLSSGRNYVSFEVKNIAPYTSLSYNIEYGTDGPNQGLEGHTALNGETSFSRQNILLGSQSAGGSISFHHGVKNIKITVGLTQQNGTVKTLEKIVE